MGIRDKNGINDAKRESSWEIGEGQLNILKYQIEKNIEQLIVFVLKKVQWIPSWKSKNITKAIPKWTGSRIRLNVLFHMTKRSIPKPYKIALYFPRQDKEKKNVAKYQKTVLSMLMIMDLSKN